MKTWPRFTIDTARTVQLRYVSHNEPRAPRSCRSFATTRRASIVSKIHADSQFEGLFINALLSASSCKRSRRKWTAYTKSIPATRRDTWVQPAMSYNRLPLLVREDIETIGLHLSKQRLIALVDSYHEANEVDLQHDMNDEANRIEVDKEIDSESAWGTHYARISNLKVVDEETREKLALVCRAIDAIGNAIYRSKHLRHKETEENLMNSLFQLYFSLPQERFLYLHPRHRQILLESVQYMPKRTPKHTLRFLTVLEDMERSNVHIPISLYNHAIHVVGRTFGKVSHKEVRSALERWISLVALSKGDVTTFNILLDIAVKGQQFALADMVLLEMDRRKVRKDRFTRVGMIYYHGLRGDGDAIRRTYRELVEKDLIVDSTVLNCVIASLLRAGEAEAAHHVYCRMRDTSAEPKKISQEELLSSKDTAKALKNMVPQLRNRDPKFLQQLQQEQDISPDRNTFVIWVNHHVSETGDLDRITYYIDEMERMGLQPHGRIFVDLFRGFWNHGRVPFTKWNSNNLSKVWRKFRHLSNDPTHTSVYWDHWAVIWLLRAYVKCVDLEAAKQVWELIKVDWQQGSEHDNLMMSVMENAKRKVHQRL